MSTLKVDAIQGSDGTSRNVVVQRVYVQDGEAATGTSLIPNDDTIPTSSEGTQFMSLAITPTNASNILKIDVVFHYGNSSTSFCTTALFQDSTANALSASMFGYLNVNCWSRMNFTHYMVAGTTSATTFKVRHGPESASTSTFNGVGGTRDMGGVMASSITITEYEA
tara:strand:+ start:3966 stop:4466 length:501 start_codon:yes stop_codon:yes gene_type:complete